MVVTANLLDPLSSIVQFLILPHSGGLIELPRLLVFLVAHLILASALIYASVATKTIMNDDNAGGEFKNCPLARVPHAIVTIAYLATVFVILIVPGGLLGDWLQGTRTNLNHPRVVEVTTLVFDMYLLLALTLFLPLLGWATSRIALSIRLDEEVSIRHASQTRARLLGSLIAVRVCAFGLAILLFVVLTTSVLVGFGSKPAIHLQLAMEKLPLEWVDLAFRIVLLSSCAVFVLASLRLHVGPTAIDRVMAEIRKVNRNRHSLLLTPDERKAVAEQLKDVDCSKCPEGFQAKFHEYLSDMARGESVMQTTLEIVASVYNKPARLDAAANVP